MIIPISIFILYNFQQLLQYFQTGQSLRAWWNNQRMERVNTMCPWLLGVANVVLKLLRISETVFEVTKKDSSSSNTDERTKLEDSNHFTFDESLLFIPGTTIVLVQVSALLMSLTRARGSGVLEVACSVWLVLCFWPFLKGMFLKGRYGLPLSTIYKSAALALFFLHLCQKNNPN